MLNLNSIYHGDATAVMDKLPEKCVNMICTSPPYLKLRRYGYDVDWPAVDYTILGFPVHVPAMRCELGQEKTHFMFIGHLVHVMRSAWRVLKDDGTLWINIGDSYAQGSKRRTPASSARSVKSSTLQGGKENHANHQLSKITAGLKMKDLILIPQMLAMALRDDGWYLRQDIVWAKTSAMPESITDRCTRAHEFIFMFSKQRKYYYNADAIKTPAKESTINRVLKQDTAKQNGSHSPAKDNGAMKAVLKDLPPGQANIRVKRDKQRGHSRRHAGFNERWDQMTRKEQQSFKANKRSVWQIAPAQFKDDHFAVFPEQLAWDMVAAGCPVGGTVLDPFFGRGTTGSVARKQDKNFIGIEAVDKNIAIAMRYIHKELNGYQRTLITV